MGIHTATPEHAHSPTIGWWSALLPLSIFVSAALLVPTTVSGGRLFLVLDWIPSLGVSLSLAVDGLSLLFVLIISLVGTAVFVFAGDYLGNHPRLRWFYLLLSLFMLSMLGLVLMDNLLALFVFWELTTLTSYLLIGFENESAEARYNARQALLVTGAGGLALLVGILLLGHIGGSYSIAELIPQADVIRRHRLYLPVLVLVLAGAFTKSAQFPFHFWLPNAMAAPTPISAFLHSATMVKAGIYLLARLHPVLGATPVWMQTLVAIGGITALWGAILAIGQEDLKRMLAFTTVMALGIMTMFLGGRSTPTLTAAITFLMVHALYKSALFMVVGILDHQTGTRMLTRLGGLRRLLPVTAAATAAAALSMAGFPLFFGFIGKEIMYKGALTEEMFPKFATFAALVSNSLMTAVAGILFLKVFYGPLQAPFRKPAEAKAAMWVGPLVLGFMGIVFGLCPDWVGRHLVEPAVLAFYPKAEDIHLKIFYGFNDPLLLSVITLALGGIGYGCRRWLRRASERIRENQPVTGSQLYGRMLDLTGVLAAVHTRTVQNGSLQGYLSAILFSVVAGVGMTLQISGFAVRLPPLNFAADAAAIEILMGVLMLCALIVLLMSRSSLLALCSLGVIGAGCAMIFLWNGAPDVALTQLLVETLTMIIVANVLLRLPAMTPHLSRPSRLLFNAGIALAAGTVVTLLLLASAAGPLDRSITAYYESFSVVKAHGRNIVNVILVDFRSFDTLGEIVVVAVAGIAGVALIRRRRPCDPSS
jgi:multicomponent Na+:H+ antiporter subunit A